MNETSVKKHRQYFFHNLLCAKEANLSSKVKVDLANK